MPVFVYLRQSVYADLNDAEGRFGTADDHAVDLIGIPLIGTKRTSELLPRMVAIGTTDIG